MNKEHYLILENPPYWDDENVDCLDIFICGSDLDIELYYKEVFE